AQHVETVIRPELEAGRHVVTDRFNGSTLAYQGFGRGLDLAVLNNVLDFATGGLEPDLTIVVDCDLETARVRSTGLKADRLEQLDPSFHARVRDGFLRLAEANASWVVIDGTQSLVDVAKATNLAIAKHLGLEVMP
ncbi:MAG: dTMP kinase, partial [Actinomycetota bacterium]